MNTMLQLLFQPIVHIISKDGIVLKVLLIGKSIIILEGSTKIDSSLQKSPHSSGKTILEVKARRMLTRRELQVGPDQQNSSKESQAYGALKELGHLEQTKVVLVIAGSLHQHQQLPRREKESRESSPTRIMIVQVSSK